MGIPELEVAGGAWLGIPPPSIGKQYRFEPGLSPSLSDPRWAQGLPRIMAHLDKSPLETKHLLGQVC